MLISSDVHRLQIKLVSHQVRKVCHFIAAFCMEFIRGVSINSSPTSKPCFAQDLWRTINIRWLCNSLVWAHYSWHYSFSSTNLPVSARRPRWTQVSRRPHRLEHLAKVQSAFFHSFAPVQLQAPAPQSVNRQDHVAAAAAMAAVAAESSFFRRSFEKRLLATAA